MVACDSALIGDCPIFCSGTNGANNVSAAGNGHTGSVCRRYHAHIAAACCECGRAFTAGVHDLEPEKCDNRWNHHARTTVSSCIVVDPLRQFLCRLRVLGRNRCSQHTTTMPMFTEMKTFGNYFTFQNKKKNGIRASVAAVGMSPKAPAIHVANPAVSLRLVDLNNCWKHINCSIQTQICKSKTLRM